MYQVEKILSLINIYNTCFSVFKTIYILVNNEALQAVVSVQSPPLHQKGSK